MAVILGFLVMDNAILFKKNLIAVDAKLTMPDLLVNASSVELGRSKVNKLSAGYKDIFNH